MFFKQLDSEIAKVEAFTLKQVQALREKLAKTEQLVASSISESEQTNVRLLTDAIGEDFLRLEKYVNINFMGFHKILKKHDRFLPNNPCKYFYVSRMHDQAWVRGDYSDLVIRMSTMYSQLCSDKTG